MARPSNTDARRAEIVEALRVVMARKGYDGASIGDIAMQAKLTPGLVHYHFKNKLEVLLALLDHLGRAHEAQLSAALAAAEKSTAHQVAAFVDFHLSVRQADPETLACWVTLSGEALRDEKVRRRYRGIVARWVECLVSIVGDTAAACAVVSAIQGYFVLAAVDKTLIPRGTAAGSVRRMAEGLLGLRLPKRRVK
jgi:TetR/AcrR family transcriptional repressor of bet genes